MSAYQRRKGADWERILAALLRANGFPDARRRIKQTRDGGVGDFEEIAGLVLDAKAGRAGPTLAAARQALAEGADAAAVLLTDRSRRLPRELLVLPLLSGLRLLARDSQRPHEPATRDPEPLDARKEPT